MNSGMNSIHLVGIDDRALGHGDRCTAPSRKLASGSQVTHPSLCNDDSNRREVTARVWLTHNSLALDEDDLVESERR